MTFSLVALLWQLIFLPAFASSTNFQVTASTPAVGSVGNNPPPTVFNITFCSTFRNNSLAPTDLTVNGIPADTATKTSSDTAQFTFTTTPVTTQGIQTMSMANGAVIRRSDDAPLDAWTGTFRYDVFLLSVTFTTPSDGGIGTMPVSFIELTWNEPVDQASIQASDLILDVGTVTGVTFPSSTRTRFSVTGLEEERRVNISVLANTVFDLFGNPNFAHTGHFDLDYFILPTATFFSSRPRPGSEIHSRITQAINTGGDIDLIYLGAIPGQLYTAQATADATGAHFGAIELYDGPNGAQLADDNPLPTTVLASGSSHKIEVGQGPGVGPYTVLEIKNAGFALDTTAVQALPPAQSLPGGVTRHGVVGFLDAATPSHSFAFNGPAGLTLATEHGASASLSIQQGATTIATQNGPEAVIQVIPAGTYTAVISGTGEYNLHLTPGAHTDEVGNLSTANAQVLTLPAVLSGFEALPAILTAETERNNSRLSSSILQNLTSANDARGSFTNATSPYTATIRGTITTNTTITSAPADIDFFRIHAKPGDSITVQQLGAPSGNGTLTDPWFRLFNRHGVLIAENDDIQPGVQLESQLTYNGFVYDGDYYMCAASKGGATGTYHLVANLTTTTPQRPLRRDVYRVDLQPCETLDPILHRSTLCRLPFGINTATLQPLLAATDASGSPLTLPHTATVSTGTEAIFLEVNPGSADTTVDVAYILELNRSSGSCVPLTVASAQGTPSPAVGTQNYSAGSTTASVTSPVTLGGFQYICTGWTGTGDVPASGTGTTTTFNLTTASSVTWQWTTNVLLTTVANPGGTTAPSSQWVAIGGTTTITATPNPGTMFTGWSDGNTTNPRTVTLTAPTTYTANFATITHPLTITSPHGSPAPFAGTQNLNDQSSITASVTSPITTGGFQYICTGWTGTGDAPASGTGTTTTFNLTTASSITWQWTTNVLLTTVANPGGTTAPSSQWVAIGGTSTITATPNPGTMFTGWSDGNTTNPRTVTLTAPTTYTANFATITHPLTITSPHGSPAPFAGTQNLNDQSSITASVSSPITTGGFQYICTGWTGTGDAPASGTATSIPGFQLTQPTTITWNWTTNVWINPTATTGGSVNLTPAWVSIGTTLTLTANPSLHYMFAGWTGDLNGTTSSGTTGEILTIPADQPRDIEATFMRDTYALTVTTPHGTPTPATSSHPSQTPINASITPTTITTGPNNGTRVDLLGWTGTGFTLASGTSSTIPTFSLDGPSAITWNWATNYLLTVNAATGGSVAPIASNTATWHPAGTIITLTATPSTHWQFSGWTGTPTPPNPTNPTITITLDQAHTLTPTFTRLDYPLTVNSPHGTTTPPVGTQLIPSQSPVTVSVATASITDPVGTTRFDVTGWTGTGSAPASGTGAATPSFNLNGPTTVTWNWSTNYFLTVATTGNGSVDLPSGWHPADSTLTLTATPGPNQTFAGWNGLPAGTPGGNTANPVTVTLDTPLAITAVFASAIRNLTIVSPHGASTPPVGIHTYPAGDTVTVTQTQPVDTQGATRYLLTGWTGTGDVPAAGTTATATFTLNQNSTLTWLWSTEHRLDLTASPSATAGSVSPSGSTWHPTGTPVTITATPAPFHSFTGWSDGTTTNPRVVTLSNPIALTATFAPVQFPLTITSPHGPTTPPAGSSSLNGGTSINASAPAQVNDPAAPGYQYNLSGWSTTGSAPVSGNTGTSTTIPAFVLDQPTIITWAWSTNVWINPTSTAGGSVSPAPAWTPLDTPVTLAATPAPHHTFTGWTGDTSGLNPSSPTLSFPANQPRDLTATFSRSTYTLNVVSPYGTTTPAIGTHTYPAETTVQVDLASPTVINGGTRHDATGWTDGISTMTGTSTGPFDLLDPVTTITFLWSTSHNLTVQSAPDGSATSLPAPGFHPHGTTVTLTATPDPFTDFLGWSDGNTDNPRTLILNAPTTLSPVFIRDSAVLTITTPRGTSTPATGNHAYLANDSVSASIAPAFLTEPSGTTRHVPTGWTGTGSVTSGTGTNAGPFILTAPQSTLTWIWATEHLLALDTIGNGSLNTSTPSATWHPDNSTITLTATPATFHTFTGWSDGNINNPRTLTLTAGTTLTATFAPIEIPVSITSPHATSSPSGSFTINQGDDLTATISPTTVTTTGTRYDLIGWTGTGDIAPGTGPTAGPFTITAPSTLTWTWATNYFLDVSATPGGSVDIPSGWYPAGTTVTLTATANPGQQFAGWNGSLPTNAGSPVTLLMDGPKTVEAVFGTDFLTFTVSTPHGTASPFAGDNLIAAGTSITPTLTDTSVTNGMTRFTATGWNGTGDLAGLGGVGAGTTPPTFTLSQDSAITWLWSTSHLVTVTAQTGGAAAPASAWHPVGATLSLTATPEPFHTFTGWSDGNTDNPRTITVNTPLDLTATFSRDTYTLTVVSPHGTPEPATGTHILPAGSTITPTNTPLLTGADTQLINNENGSLPSFTLTQDTTLSWTWSTNYWIVTDAGLGGTLNPGPNPTGTWQPAGTSITLTAVPDTYYTHARWTGDLPSTTSPSQNPITIPVDQPRSLTAIFERLNVPLTITTPFGQTIPTIPVTGTQTLPAGTITNVALASTTITEPTGRTRHIATGFTGTGDVPASGNALITPDFTLTQASSVTFLWRTEHQLTTTAQLNGSVSPPSDWYPAGTNLLLTATPPPGLQFGGWMGDIDPANATQNPLPITLDAPRSLTATFTTNTVTLTGPDEPNGTTTYPVGTLLTLTHPSPVTSNSTTRTTVIGHTGTGDITPGPGAVIGPFTLTQNSSYDWETRTDVRLTLTTEGDGTIQSTPALPLDGWLPRGATINLTAQPSTYAQFLRWTGNLNGVADPTSPAIQIELNSPAVLNAIFQTPTYTVTRPAGITPHPAGTELTYDTPEFETLTTTTRYRIIGYTGTGSIASGTGNTIPTFTLLADSSFTWTRQLEVNLQLQANISGPTGWMPADTLVTLTPVPPVGQQFTAWSNGDTASTLTLPAANAGAITASFEPIPDPEPDEVTLTIISPFGSPDPAGTTVHPLGTTLTPTLAETTITSSPGTRHISTGADLPLPLTLNENTTLTWTWRTEHQLTLPASADIPHGTLANLDDLATWYSAGATIALTVLPDPDHQFTQWTGDTNVLTQTSADTWTLTLNAPVFLTPHFDVIRSPLGIPKPWFTENNIPFDDADDSDGDHVPASDEWLTGTNPADGTSFLHLTLQGGAHPTDITWTSAPDRSYTLWRADHPEGPYQPIATNLDATPPLNSLPPGTLLDPLKFYRITCEFPRAAK